MFVVIFGRPGCPFCVRAKELADTLKEDREASTTVMSTSTPKASARQTLKKNSR